jgi:arylformamidase
MMSILDLTKICSDLKIVELSHMLEENIPTIPTHAKFAHIPWKSMELGDKTNHYEIIVHEHNGTHVDMPAHFVRGGADAGTMGAGSFIGPCVTLDFSDIGENGVVTKERITSWENHNGAINPGDIVLLNVGWAQYWHTRPNDKRFCTDYPGVSKEAAEYLLARKIKMVGIDTMSIDASHGEGNPAHNTFLPNNVLIVENLTNLQDMPIHGYFIALPLIIRQGSGGPVRAIALIDK